MSKAQTSKPQNVAFIHPDLGLGGAERLIVDAACGLQNLGHKVTMFTTHHEPKRCFSETVDGTLKVFVHGDFLPRAIFNKLSILFATLRMLWCTFMVSLFYPAFDVIVVDQVSAVIPLARFFAFLLQRRTKIVFYCHFPDKLLSTHNQDSPIVKKHLAPRGSLSQPKQDQPHKKSNFLQKLYRSVFDYLEEKTTGMAHAIMVNSKFTSRVFRDAFPSIQDAKLNVLYPPINCALYDKKPTGEAPKEELVSVLSGKKGIVSINRFERKKGITLAVEAFAKLKEKLPEQEFKKLVLILAGGYDKRLQENVDYVKELQERVNQHGLTNQTVFLCSFSEADRYVLLHEPQILLYTPENEHFGIVPVEAMYSERCVVAVNSGGPLESIANEETGLLVDPEPEEFANAIVKFLKMSDEQVAQYGKRARDRVLQLFSLEVFAKKFDDVVQEVIKQ